MLFTKKRKKKEGILLYKRSGQSNQYDSSVQLYSKPKRCANLEIVRNKEIMEQF